MDFLNYLKICFFMEFLKFLMFLTFFIFFIWVCFGWKNKNCFWFYFDFYGYENDSKNNRDFIKIVIIWFWKFLSIWI